MEISFEMLAALGSGLTCIGVGAAKVFSYKSNGYKFKGVAKEVCDTRHEGLKDLMNTKIDSILTLIQQQNRQNDIRLGNIEKSLVSLNLFLQQHE